MTAQLCVCYAHEARHSRSRRRSHEQDRDRRHGVGVAHICCAGDCTIHCLHYGQCTIWKASAARRLCGIEQGLLARSRARDQGHTDSKNGVFVIRKGKATVRREGQCPVGTEAEVQVVFYQMRSSSSRWQDTSPARA